MRDSKRTTPQPASSLHLWIASAAIVGLVVACSKDPLTPLTMGLNANMHYINVDAQFCTSAPNPVQENIKYVFIMDHSQSNQPGFPLFAADVANTDPTGSRRYGPLVQFINNLQPNPSIQTSFSLIDFNDSAWEVQPGAVNCNAAGQDQVGNACLVNFVSGVNAASTFLNQIVVPDWVGSGSNAAPQPVDGGFTNYVDALTLAQILVSADVNLSTGNPITPIVKTVYQIIFVTDGTPTIAVIPTPTNPSPIYVQTFNNDIQPVMDSLLNLMTNPALKPYIANIALNTGFYLPDTLPPNPALTPAQSTTETNAEDLLQQMATYGNGLYQVYGSGQAINYEIFAPPIHNLKYQFQDLFVENENVVWWDDGQLYMDSDGDGLPDTVEGANGSNPLVADSDGNGVSDLVEYRLTGHPCQDANCNPANRNPYSFCDGLTPSVDGNGNITYPDTDGDGLNDCEEFLLKSDRTNFDSNGDFIPDFLQFKANIPFIAGTTSATAMPMGDGMTNYAKLKAGYPLAVPYKQLLNFQARVTQLMRMPSPADNIDCYDAQVNNVAAMGTGNTIKISLIQNVSVVSNSPILETAVRALNGESNLVTFAPGDFQPAGIPSGN